MASLSEIGPGQLFAWQGGIFVRSDSTKQGNGSVLAAVTVIRKTIPTVSGLPPDTNELGATVWMRLDTPVSLLTADIYLGDKCIHRMWENSLDEEPSGGIVEA